MIFRFLCRGGCCGDDGAPRSHGLRGLDSSPWRQRGVTSDGGAPIELHGLSFRRFHKQELKRMGVGRVMIIFVFKIDKQMLKKSQLH